MTLASRLFATARFLAWPTVLCVSLAAHAGVALWLMQTEPPQAEGDLPDVLPLEVAYIAAPMPVAKPVAKPVATPLAEPVVDEVEEALALPTPAVAPIQDKPVTAEPEPEPEPTQPKPEAKVETAKAAKGATPVAPQAKPPKAKPQKKAERAKTPQRVEKKVVKQAAPEAKPAQPAKPAKAGSAAGNRKWASKIRSRIERRKKYPAAAKGAAGSVTVSIRIAASGALSGVALAGSSGNAALDAAALKAVQNAAPFPPAPKGEDGAEFSLIMVFSRG